MHYLRRIRHAPKDPASSCTHPRDNLYRFQLFPDTLLISKIEAFNKIPALRQVEGRWTECRSLNVYAILQREFAK